MIEGASENAVRSCIPTEREQDDVTAGRESGSTDVDREVGCQSEEQVSAVLRQIFRLQADRDDDGEFDGFKESKGAWHFHLLMGHVQEEMEGVAKLVKDVFSAKPAHSNGKQKQKDMFINLVDRTTYTICKPCLSVHAVRKDRAKCHKKYNEFQQLITSSPSTSGLKLYDEDETSRHILAPILRRKQLETTEKLSGVINRMTGRRAKLPGKLDKVNAMAARRQQLKACVILSHLMDDLVGRRKSYQQPVTAVQAATVKKKGVVFQQTFKELQKLVDQSGDSYLEAVCSLVRQRDVSADDIVVAARHLDVDASARHDLKIIGRAMGRQEIKASLAVCNRLNDMLKIRDMLKTQSTDNLRLISTLPTGKGVKVRHHIEMFLTDFKRLKQLASQHNLFTSCLSREMTVQ